MKDIKVLRKADELFLTHAGIHFPIDGRYYKSFTYFGIPYDGYIIGKEELPKRVWYKLLVIRKH